jgi:hypothetical protein
MTILAALSRYRPHPAIQIEFGAREANHFPNSLPGRQTKSDNSANIRTKVVEVVPYSFGFGIR